MCTDMNSSVSPSRTRTCARRRNKRTPRLIEPARHMADADVHSRCQHRANAHSCPGNSRKARQRSGALRPGGPAAARGPGHATNLHRHAVLVAVVPLPAVRPAVDRAELPKPVPARVRATVVSRAHKDGTLCAGLLHDTLHPHKGSNLKGGGGGGPRVPPELADVDAAIGVLLHAGAVRVVAVKLPDVERPVGPAEQPAPVPHARAHLAKVLDASVWVGYPIHTATASPCAAPLAGYSRRAVQERAPRFPGGEGKRRRQAGGGAGLAARDTTGQHAPGRRSSGRGGRAACPLSTRGGTRLVRLVRGRARA